ncbi:MAG: cytochrome b/b6 domain-containing protein [Methylococcales bacterium]|nr:cytochrome B [Methylococcaceae bacterium]
MSNQPLVQVWDILIRIFHWSLVASFAVAYLSSEEDNPWHIYSGYTVLGLIVFRVIWGFVGSKHARFSDFLSSPSAVVGYFKNLRSDNPTHYLGHNPAGGWMVIALLVTLFAVTLSGLKLYAIEEGKGPLAMESMQLSPISAALAEDDDDDDDKKENKSEKENEKEAEAEGEDFWEEIHEASTNIMLALIALHILGVIISSILHKEKLVKAMITGKKERL